MAVEPSASDSRKTTVNVVARATSTAISRLVMPSPGRHRHIPREYVLGGQTGMEDLDEIRAQPIGMRDAPRPVVVRTRCLLTAFVGPDLPVPVRLERDIPRLVVEHRRQARPSAAVDPDVGVGG